MPRIQLQMTLDFVLSLFKEGHKINAEIIKGIPLDTSITGVWLDKEREVLILKCNTKNKSFKNNQVVEIVARRLNG